jgi:hypothetical protein
MLHAHKALQVVEPLLKLLQRVQYEVLDELLLLLLLMLVHVQALVLLLILNMMCRMLKLLLLLLLLLHERLLLLGRVLDQTAGGDVRGLSWPQDG